MPNLTPAQLAEGARLLAKLTDGKWAYATTLNNWPSGERQPDVLLEWILNTEYDNEENDGNAIAWLMNHGQDLLASAQRVAEVEGCVREIAAKLQWCAQLNADGLENNPGSPHYRSRKEAFDDAVEYVREIAAEHNIDLSEPTPTGETKGGEG